MPKPLRASTEDGEPGAQISAKDLVLRGRVLGISPSLVRVVR
jgi:hypothetical protein